MSQDETTAARPMVVVVDDDDAARDSLGQMLELRGHRVMLFPGARAALDWGGLSEAGCVIADIKMPEMDGEELLGELKRRDPHLPVIMVTGFGDVDVAVRCLKGGAYDFVVKPFDDDVLTAAVTRALERARLHRQSKALEARLEELSDGEHGCFGMVGTSSVMRTLYSQIESIARTNATALIVGETGVGKELVARAIHDKSARRKGPFVAVNAGALPEHMMESELFGHARGAFTGADYWRDGKIVAASGGTLLLDEVESISERAQRQLLRVLEDGLVYPLGRDKPQEVDVRVLATTKLNLRQLVTDGKMREDFYHRIVVVSIAVPPLRERCDDIPLLVSHFLKLAARRNDLPVAHVPETTLGAMLRHGWPGNVRELRNSVERLLITAEDDVVGEFSPGDADCAARLLSLPATAGPLRQQMEQTERRVIEAALCEHGGQITETAQALGISRRALYDRLKKYDLHRHDYD